MVLLVEREGQTLVQRALSNDVLQAYLARKKPLDYSICSQIRWIMGGGNGHSVCHEIYSLYNSTTRLHYIKFWLNNISPVLPATKCIPLLEPASLFAFHLELSFYSERKGLKI
ncbi:unnamed protein product [Natator depressus]